MKVKRISTLMTIVLVAVFITALPIGHLTADAVGETYRLKIQSAYPRGDLSMELLKDFAQTANKLSKGQIKIQVFADPELVPADQ
jgi:TRAP-type C4-dicarboxylate transport system substrate-binding protein